MSTPSRSASSSTRSADLTLKPMMIAVVDRGQVDVVLRDRTDTAVDDPQLDLVADVDLEQGVLECLDGTGDVALEDQVEGLDLALLRAPA